MPSGISRITIHSDAQNGGLHEDVKFGCLVRTSKDICRVATHAAVEVALHFDTAIEVSVFADFVSE